MRLNNFFDKLKFADLIWIAIGSMVTIFLYFLNRQADTKHLFGLSVLIFLAILYTIVFYKEKEVDRVNKLLLGISTVLVLQFLNVLYKSYLRVNEWDFMAFYLFAHSGLSGSNFYDPSLYHSLFHELNLDTLVSTSFVRDIVDVGFWYPPPSMLLFMPLGWFDLNTGFFLWQSIIVLFLIADIVLVITIFKPYAKGKSNTLYLFSLLILILIFPGLTKTLLFSQTNTLLLFFLLLTVKNQNHWSAGVYLCLMIFIKPLAVIFGLYFLYFRNWKALLSSAATGILIVLLTVLVFGGEIFYSYFSSLPTSRMNDCIFLEDINTSLNSVLLRFQATNIQTISLTSIKTVLYSVTILFTAVSIYLAHYARKSSAQLSILLFVPLTLIIYPGTLSHYSILLLPVALFIFKEFQEYKNPFFPLTSLFVLYLSGVSNLFYFNIIAFMLLSYFVISTKQASPPTPRIRSTIEKKVFGT
ncbi:MAG: DUF2029 domain-containing protein [Bacteroidales bacterium]|nr:DUF2029 domain-containing protein [Bacteroidales bacterium]MCF8455158.1 DUF2029 domain-containing protein [Bacteroidales bacterium]